MKDFRLYNQIRLHTQLLVLRFTSPCLSHLSLLRHYNLLTLSSLGSGLTSDPADGSGSSVHDTSVALHDLIVLVLPLAVELGNGDESGGSESRPWFKREDRGPAAF